MEALTQIFQAASQDMYKQSNEGQPTPESDASESTEDVTDVDFEEVK
jgi:hypothetical protein